MSSDIEKPFLSVGETAQLLGVHENTVRNWVRSGTLVSARVPGSKQHRFSREEVLRLVRQRGNPTSSVAPQLRSVEPELVSAVELDQWAARNDAKGAFPDLVRRLLELTPGITKIDVRAHEGGAAPGWDGSASSTGTPYLPAGELRFEFGTEKNSKGKAQSDYDKRVLALPADSESIFIFATPRSWANGRGWAVERAEEKKFAGVKAIDAQILEGWLRATPSVHYWISERLGYRPGDAQTILRWWDSFQGRARLQIPSPFFRAGRTKEVDELITLLKAASALEPTATVKAPWRDEALAFVYAALESDPALLNRTVVVTDASAWSRLVASHQQMILVPLFEDSVDFKAAEDAGHRVIMIAGGDEIVRNGLAIELRKIDRAVARESLKGVIDDSDAAEALVALGRRSMPALFRSIAREPRLATPEWVKDSRILAPLVLAGSWTEHEGDIATIEKLTGSTSPEVSHLLKALAKRPDAPFVVSGGVWRLASPEEAAYLLLRELTPSDFARWGDIVLEVLLAEDPFSGMDTASRLTAGAQGMKPAYSSILQKHLAQGLTLAGATADNLPADLQIQQRVNDIVRRLLERAAADPTGEVWARLAPVLPSLAEAAPEAFLDAVEADLERSEPILKTMFKDRDGGNDPFGPSSPHPDLLWALETLCWSPDYFGRTAGLLARVAAIDPGGRLSNRPAESLQKVTVGWVAQSGGGVEEKVTIIERALQRTPDVGWSLLLAVWPSPHSVAFAPRQPMYRDWTPKKPTVTLNDWGLFVRELVRLAIQAAGDLADRWQQLVPHIDSVPSRERHAIIAAFRAIAQNAEWSSDERYALWNAFVSEADRHEEYSDADWAMPAEDVALFREAADSLAPTDDPRRHSKLFDWHASVPGLKPGDDGYDSKLEDLQRGSIRELLASGLAGLEALIIEVRVPWVIGNHLALMDDSPADQILAWLASEAPNLRSAAFTYAGRKIDRHGLHWLKAALRSPGVARSEARLSLMAAVPFAKTYWDEIDSLEESLAAAYWQRVHHYSVPEAERAEAVGLLLKHERPWQAVGVLNDMLHSGQVPEVQLIKMTLQEVITSTGPVEEQQMTSYYIGQLLTYLETQAPDDPELPDLEFAFFNIVHDHRPSGALYRHLGNNPDKFVNLVKAVYRGDGEARRKLTAQEQAFGHVAWSVLREWPVLPGLHEDGTVDGTHLGEWVRNARFALADLGRAAIGDEQIGQVLASSPVGSDGVWPHEEVREIVENIGNARIDAGLHLGRTNQRGVTSRGIFDGGNQERALEQEYRDMAAQISTRWPRTARILRGIADGYQGEARRHDAEAERLGDDG
ncbi:helix-turn-helix domain-containing protein [Sinomonas albida]|uniref:helix-turn-helix domain-containing protein n=1 Tax=Sinomonas albida TaxID=369942 RepID=UPI0030196BD1